MTAYYNENDFAAAHVLRCLIEDGLIAPGIVDDRSIKEVSANDLRGFEQVHLFAGAGTWSVAARIAGWPDDKPLWTASCPCQPFSAAGKGAGTDDPRHLWPDVFRILRDARAQGFGPDVVMGEQVAGKAGYNWFDGVRSDLASEGYACGVRDIPALAVDAPHERNRLYWGAVAQPDEFNGRAGTGGEDGAQAHDIHARGEALDDAAGTRCFDGGGEEVETVRDQAWGCEPERRDGNGGVGLVHTTSERRGEGQSEPELRSGRSAPTGANASDPLMGHTAGIRRQVPLEGRQPTIQRPIGTGHSHGNLGISAGNGREQGFTGAEAARYGDQPSAAHGRNGSFWSDAETIICHDGKARRTKPGVRLLVNGMAGRVHLWRLAGNSIVAQEAAEVLGAFLDAERMIRGAA